MPDGSEVVTTRQADPRWGDDTPIVSTTTTLPSGLSLVETRTRTVNLTDEVNPFSMTQQTDTRIVNGRETTTQYVVGAGTFTTTTPEGRTSVREIDALADAANRTRGLAGGHV
jgi:hypothetical protein